MAVPLGRKTFVWFLFLFFHRPPRCYRTYASSSFIILETQPSCYFSDSISIPASLGDVSLLHSLHVLCIVLFIVIQALWKGVPFLFGDWTKVEWLCFIQRQTANLYWNRAQNTVSLSSQLCVYLFACLKSHYLFFLFLTEKNDVSLTLSPRLGNSNSMGSTANWNSFRMSLLI